VKFNAAIRTPAGATLSRVLEAPSRAEAHRALRAEGNLVLSLEEQAPPAPAKKSFSILPPGALDIEFGLQQLATMLRSGLPLLAALRTTAEQSVRPATARMWNRVADRIESGGTLLSAMEATRRFDPYTLALVRIGEQSGELDSAMTRAAAHREQVRTTRALLVNATIYPALVVLLTVAVVSLMVLKVIPQIEEFLLNANAELPWLTQLLLDVSSAVRDRAPHVLLALAAAAVAVFLVRLHPAGRRFTDGLLLRVPVTGHLLRLSATAVAARGLSILLESGVTLLDSLQTVSTLLRNRRLRQRIDDARDAVIRGLPLADALAPATEFPPMLSRMAAIGESTGTLAAALAEVARYHENRLLAAIRRFGVLIEPVLILVVGGIVGFVYTAFFMALFSLATPH
jgi:type IV pilus assembly protein PilC